MRGSEATYLVDRERGARSLETLGASERFFEIAALVLAASSRTLIGVSEAVDNEGVRGLNLFS